MQFDLAQPLDPKPIAARFAAHGRVQIGNFLKPEAAMDLRRQLSEAGGWKLTANRGDTVVDFVADEVAGWPAERRAKLDEAVGAGGRYGFQYLYETIRCGDAEKKRGDVLPALAAFADFMSDASMVDWLRRITGAGDAAFCDAHASRYHPGHFLTTHDDRVDTMGRRAAYVLNLTPEWRADWGGLLLFFDRDGNVARGFTPAFNSLTLFSVGQPHNVTMVTPLAGAPRYAVTGWLRANAGAPTKKA